MGGGEEQGDKQECADGEFSKLRKVSQFGLRRTIRSVMHCFRHDEKRTIGDWSNVIVPKLILFEMIGFWMRQSQSKSIVEVMFSMVKCRGFQEAGSLGRIVLPIRASVADGGRLN